MFLFIKLAIEFPSSFHFNSIDNWYYRPQSGRNDDNDYIFKLKMVKFVSTLRCMVKSLSIRGFVDYILAYVTDR